jgi:predicted nucleic acid-binding protein
MIVVADSGPLHYLIPLEHGELLRRFYGHVLVQEPVAKELSAAGKLWVGIAGRALRP